MQSACGMDAATGTMDGAGALQMYAARHQEGLLQIKMLFSGGAAGCFAKTAVAPLSRVTILMQVQSMRPHKFERRGRPNNQHVVESLRKIVREEGWMALWRGNGATLLHRFPYTASTFYANGSFKRRLDKEPFVSVVPIQARSFVAGGASACLSILLCYPMDVVKTRLTSQTKTQYYTGIVHALSRIWRDEGVRGLYRGLGMSICSTVPNLACNFALYDCFRALHLGLGWAPSLHALVAGGLSGALSSTLLFPADLLRRQMQMVGLGGRPAVYGTVWEALRHIYQTGYHGAASSRVRPLWGLREFFRGLTPELFKVAPFNAMMFAAHGELLRCRWPFESLPS